MKNLLKKCIDELAKEDPKLDYVRGILETLAEQEEKPSVPPVTFTPVSLKPHDNIGVSDGGAWSVLSQKS
jgi:hypothetical protein